MQFTRFLRNAAVTAVEMSRHAGVLTAERVAGRDVLVIQDTSELVLCGARARKAGYGPVGKGGATGGLLLHPALVFEAPSGELLGPLSIQVWNRTGGKVAARRRRTTAQKESQRWLTVVREAGEMLSTARSVTVLSDREADAYELFAQRPDNVHLLVRACQNRRIALSDELSDELSPDEEAAADELLFAFIDHQAEQGRYAVRIPAAPGRKQRDAVLAVRFAPVVLRRPLNGADAKLPETLAVTLLDLREVGQPADGSKPLHWRLLTSHTVSHLDQARHLIELYRQRWRIEEFFRTLKTAGFDIEAADISEPQAMINLVAAATIAAVTIKQLVQAREGNTNQRLPDAFDADDQPILEAVSAKLEGKTERQRNPHPKGTLAFAAWVMARLGGWTGYYGKPGPHVMRRGLEEFHAIRYGAALALHDV